MQKNLCICLKTNPKNTEQGISLVEVSDNKSFSLIFCPLKIIFKDFFAISPL